MILNIIVRTFLSLENGMNLNWKHTAYEKSLLLAITTLMNIRMILRHSERVMKSLHRQ